MTAAARILRSKRQPTHLSRVDRSHPLAAGLKVAWVGGREIAAGLPTIKNGGTWGADINGVYWQSGGGSDHLAIPLDRLTDTGLGDERLTVVALGSFSGGGIVSCAVGNTASTGWELKPELWNNTGRVGFTTQYNAGGDIDSGISTPTAPGAFIAAAAVGTRITFLVNDTSSVSEIVGGYYGSTSGGTLRIGNSRTELNHPLPSGDRVYAVFIWDRALSLAELRALRRDPYQILRAVVPGRYAFEGAGGGSAELVVDGCSHSHAVDLVSLIQSNTLGANDSAHGHVADAVSLSQINVIALADAVHAHTVDGVALSQSANISADDAAHGHTADSASLTQANILDPVEALHAQAADGVELSQGGSLSPADSLHAHSVDAVALTQANQITPADSEHAHTADSPALSAQSTLSAADALHGHTAEAVTLIQANLLSVSDALHSQAADAVMLELAGVLVVQGAIQAQLVDGVVLAQANTIQVADAAHAHLAEQVTLSQGVSLSPDGSMHNQSADGLGISIGHLLTVDDAFQPVASDVIGLLQDGVLVVSDALHAHIVDNLTMGGGSFQIGGRLMVVSGFDRVMTVSGFDRVVSAAEP